jgi:hypothetical protein
MGQKDACTCSERHKGAARRFPVKPLKQMMLGSRSIVDLLGLTSAWQTVAQPGARRRLGRMAGADKSLARPRKSPLERVRASRPVNRFPR